MPGNQVTKRDCPFCGEPVSTNQLYNHLPCSGVRENDDRMIADGGNI